MLQYRNRISIACKQVVWERYLSNVASSTVLETKVKEARDCWSRTCACWKQSTKQVSEQHTAMLDTNLNTLEAERCRKVQKLCKAIATWLLQTTRGWIPLMEDKKVTNRWPKAKNEKVIAQRLTWCRTECYYCKSKAGVSRKEKGSANERNVKPEHQVWNADWLRFLWNPELLVQ